MSAFNNAGFDLTGGFRSFEGFADSPPILLTTAVLIVLGGLGVAIVDDVAHRRTWVRLTVETKIVLVETAALLVGGAVLIAALEWGNPATFGPLPDRSRGQRAVPLGVAALGRHRVRADRGARARRPCSWGWR